MKALAQNRDWLACPHCHAKEVLGSTFYHFFFAVLMPLLDCARSGLFSEHQRVFLIGCRLFNPILRELIDRRILNLKIVPSIEPIRQMERLGQRIDYFVLDSYETYFHEFGRFSIRPFAVNGSRFQDIAAFTRAKFEIQKSPSPSPDVTIIVRVTGEGGHGTTTRAVPNLGCLVHTLADRGISAEIVSLEGKTLAEQIDLFFNAKIIVSQHGSALSNLVWAIPGKTKLIEIVPPFFRHVGWQYFEVLADAMGIKRIEVPQKDSFSEIDPVSLAEMVEKL